MTSIDTYRKQAKQLVRWHRDRNFSVGEKVRLLVRFRDLGDADILAMPFPLALAQEVIAVEAGYTDWAALKAAKPGAGPVKPIEKRTVPEMINITPILFVRDVTAAARFYSEKLGFEIDFLHGKPPFYGAVSRGAVCLHLRFVERPNFVELADREASLILASIEVRNVKALFEMFETRGVSFAQRLMRQVWGGLDFQVCDPDGNIISFVEYNEPGGAAPAK